jgi:hypothetical protein
MDEKHLCDGQVVCPWHGLRFGGVVLGNGGRDSWRYLQVTVHHKGDHLQVVPSADAGAQQASAVAEAAANH